MSPHGVLNEVCGTYVVRTKSRLVLHLPYVWQNEVSTHLIHMQSYMYSGFRVLHTSPQITCAFPLVIPYCKYIQELHCSVHCVSNR